MLTPDVALLEEKVVTFQNVGRKRALNCFWMKNGCLLLATCERERERVWLFKQHRVHRLPWRLNHGGPELWRQRQQAKPKIVFRFILINKLPQNSCAA